MSDYYIYNGRLYSYDYLQHHGILGQKWGKKNGPPYPLDGQDHSSSEKKAGWRKSLKNTSAESDKQVSNTKKKDNSKSAMYKSFVQDYKDMGYDTKKAKELADKKHDILKKGLIAAGIVGGTVLAGAIAYKLGTNYIDYTIKAGTTIQTLSKDPDRLQQGHLFYTNYLKLDKNIYAGSHFAKTTQFNVDKMSFEKVFKNKIQANTLQDMRIASDKSAQKIFSKAYSTPEAKQIMDEIKRHYKDKPEMYDKQLMHYIELAEEGKLEKWANSKMHYVSRVGTGLKGKNITLYEQFNRSIMPDDDPQYVKFTKIFTDALRKEGYAGVIDVNDTKISRLRGIRPTIITDTSKVNVMNAVSSRITQTEFNKLHRNSFRAMSILNAADENPLALAGSISGTVLGGTAYAMAIADAQADYNYYNYKKQQRKSQ